MSVQALLLLLRLLLWPWTVLSISGKKYAERNQLSASPRCKVQSPTAAGFAIWLSTTRRAGQQTLIELC